MSNPNIATAIESIHGLGGYYEAQHKEPPDASDASEVLALANARRVHLSPQQWEQAWRLGKTDLNLACAKVRGETCENISDAVFRVVDYFAPESHTGRLQGS